MLKQLKANYDKAVTATRSAIAAAGGYKPNDKNVYNLQQKTTRINSQIKSLTAKVEKAQTVRSQWLKDQARAARDKAADNPAKGKKGGKGGSSNVSSGSVATSTVGGGDYSSVPSVDPTAYQTNYAGISPAQMRAINKQIMAYKNMIGGMGGGANAAANLQFNPQMSALQNMIGNLQGQIPVGRNQIFSWYGFNPDMTQNPHPASVLGAHMQNAAANTAAYEGFPADMANIASGIAGAMGGGANPGVGMIQQAGSEWAGLMGALGANQGAFDNSMQGIIAQSALDQAHGYSMGLQQQIADARAQLSDLRSQKGTARAAYKLDALDKKLSAQANLVDLMTAQALLPGQVAQIASGVNTANAGIASDAAGLELERAKLSQQDRQFIQSLAQDQAKTNEPLQMQPAQETELRRVINRTFIVPNKAAIVKGTITPQQIYQTVMNYLTQIGFTNQAQMHNVVINMMRGIGPKYTSRYPNFFKNNPIRTAQPPAAVNPLDIIGG